MASLTGTDRHWHDIAELIAAEGRLGLVEAGVLRSTLTADYGRISAANLRRAHAAVETGRTIGKLVLSGF